MADVSECIGKLVSTGAITRAVADQALDMFTRSKAEYTKQMGPASADAAAALEAAKKLRETAAKKQLAIAAGVKEHIRQFFRRRREQFAGFFLRHASAQRAGARGRELLR